MRIAEVFGRAVEDTSDEAWSIRRTKQCPFRGNQCTKSSKTDPIGICTLTNGIDATVMCPVRFTDGGRIFTDSARLAFGEQVSFLVVPEVRILRVYSDRGRDKKIGKVDYLLGRIDGERITDFAALEVQGTYFSGRQIRPALRYFLAHGSLDPQISDRRADYRSSAQKRLVPQLRLKVPVFRRWGKKFYVVIDSLFFNELPTFRTTTSSNSEVTWLSYPIRLEGSSFKMKDPQIVFSEFDEVLNSLREGEAPEPEEIIAQLEAKLRLPERRRPTVLRT